MRILFWNIKRKALGSVLSDLANEHDVDVVILAECIEPGRILHDVNKETTQLFHLIDTKSRVTIISRISPQKVQRIDNDHGKHLALNRIQHLSGDILLAAVHLPSKMWKDTDDQGRLARWIACDIANAEKDIGHSRTVLVGDLNMNPFEQGMIAADAFHGVMTMERARRSAREIEGKQYKFFYNPMWGFFGDNSKGPTRDLSSLWLKRR